MTGPVSGLAAPPADRLPDGFTVALDRRTRRLVAANGGTALLGLSPGRLLHLAPAASALLGGTDRLTVADRTSATLARRLLDAGVAHPVVAGTGVSGGPPEREVTVVIPVRDRRDELRRLLTALAWTAPELAEVIVVDDGSSVPVVAPGARVIRHVAGAGPAAARNTGLAAARTELVAFLDSDTVPEPGWLTPLRGHLADRSVALVAPRVVALPGRDDWLAGYERLRSALDLGPDPAPVLPHTRVAYVPSAALLVRRSALGPGFNRRMHVAEDVDLVLRLHAAGWRLRYEPAARVAHEHRTAALNWWIRKAFYGTGAAPLADRHPGSVPPLVLTPWAAAASLLVGTQRGWGVAGAGVVTGVAWWRLRGTLSRLRDPGRTAALLVGLGLGGAAMQVADVLIRHWWPLTALGCVFSRRMRRAALAAGLVEGLFDWWTHRPPPGTEPGLDPLRYLLAHRTDDLGYGAGLWWGAIKARTPAPLLPLITGRRRTAARLREGGLTTEGDAGGLRSRLPLWAGLFGVAGYRVANGDVG
jgi:mycofactocin system glycosyltransferase